MQMLLLSEEVSSKRRRASPRGLQLHRGWSDEMVHRVRAVFEKQVRHFRQSHPQRRTSRRQMGAQSTFAIWRSHGVEVVSSTVPLW